MKTTLIIRVPPPATSLDATTVVQWGEFTSDGGPIGETRSTTLEKVRDDWVLQKHGSDDGSETDQPTDLCPDKVVVLLPGTLLYHTRMPITQGQRRHLATALPYMIEEDLATNVEQMHLAHLLHREEQEISVSAIDSEQMELLIGLLEAQQLSVQEVLCELALVGHSADGVQLLLEDETVTCLGNGNPVTTLDYRAFEYLLEDGDFLRGQTSDDDSEESVVEGEETSLVQSVLVRSQKQMVEKQRGDLIQRLQSGGFQVSEETLSDSVLGYLASKYADAVKTTGLVNLRHGAWRCPGRSNRTLKRWRPLALVVVAGVVLQLLFEVGQGILFRQKAVAYWQASATLYLDAFPHDRQVKEAQALGETGTNLKGRMESRLGAQNSRSDNFLPMLQQVSAQLSEKKHQLLKPVSLDFNESANRLVLVVEAPDHDAVNGLLTDVKATGLAARLDRADQGKSTVRAQMTISR